MRGFEPGIERFSEAFLGEKAMRTMLEWRLALHSHIPLTGSAPPNHLSPMGRGMAAVPGVLPKRKIPEAGFGDRH